MRPSVACRTLALLTLLAAFAVPTAPAARSAPPHELEPIPESSVVSRRVPPVFRWDDADGLPDTRYELWFSAREDLRKTKRLPRRKRRFLDGRSVTLTKRSWRRLVRFARRSDDRSTLHWWVLAHDERGVRTVSDVSTLGLKD